MGLVGLSALSIIIGLLLFRTAFAGHYFSLFPLLVVIFLLCERIFLLHVLPFHAQNRCTNSSAFSWHLQASRSWFT